MPPKRYHNWVVVLQLGSEESRPESKPDGVSYYRYSVEMAPTTGQLHAQGMAHYDSAVPFSVVKGHFPGAHLEPMKGSLKQNLAYTGKDQTHVSGPFEFGTCPRQGHRSDLEQAAVMVRDAPTLPLKRVAQELPVTFVRYHRGLRALDFAINPSPDWRELEVIWLWGRTGVGKTRYVYDLYKPNCTERLFRLVEPYQWWDGYDKQEAVLFDEFYGQIPAHSMLELLDGHPRQLPIKGSFVWAFYTHVYVTSNLDPQRVYPSLPGDVREAFFRRINKIIHLE